MGKTLPSDSYIAWKPDAAVKLRDNNDRPGYDLVSIPTLFKQTVEKYPNNVALAIERDGEIKNWTYKEYFNTTRLVAKAFLKLGLERHHAVNIISSNSPEYCICYNAAIMAGGIANGIFVTNKSSAVEYISNHSRGQIMVVENDTHLQKVLEVIGNLKYLKAIVLLNGQSSRPIIWSWENLLEEGYLQSNFQLDQVIDSLAVNQCCSSMYTSGTTGNPKGVMFSHDNIMFSSKCMVEYLGMQDHGTEVVLSIFPQSHTGGMIITFLTLRIGGTLFNARKNVLSEGIIQDLQNVRPTTFMMVTGHILFLKTEYETKFQDKTMEEFINYVGLDRCKKLVFGGMPTPSEVNDFLDSLPLSTPEGFSMTETCGLGSSSGELVPIKRNCSGAPHPAIKMKIDNPDAKGNGELLIYGRNIFMGYMHDEKNTRAAFTHDEEWFHTEDVACIDEEGYLKITGRIKEIITLLSTYNIANIIPYPVESSIRKELTFLSHCILIGEGREHLTTLLTLKSFPDASGNVILSDAAKMELAKYGFSNMETMEDVLESKELENVVRDGIHKATREFDRTDVKKFTILKNDFSLENNELTSTLKPKRAAITKKYAKEIDQMYQ